MSLNRIRSAGYMTNWTARLFTAAIGPRLKSLGISPAHLPIFFALGDGKALTLKALTEIAAVEHPTMVATLQRMERDGLITRTSNPKDRRSSFISLTDKARAKVDDVRRATEDVNAIALSHLNGDEREQFFRIQEKIINALEQDTIKGKQPHSST